MPHAPKAGHKLATTAAADRQLWFADVAGNRCEFLYLESEPIGVP